MLQNTHFNKSVFSFPLQLTMWHCRRLQLRAVLRRRCGRRCRLTSPGGTALSSKPAAAVCE